MTIYCEFYNHKCKIYENISTKNMKKIKVYGCNVLCYMSSSTTLFENKFVKDENHESC